MNRRQWVAAAALSALAVGVGGGYALAEIQHHAWVARENTAGTAITANQTTLQSWRATGQDPHQLLRQCQDAVRDYDTAAQHLGDSPLNPDQECAIP